jgi:hypothetical protein
LTQRRRVHAKALRTQRGGFARRRKERKEGDAKKKSWRKEEGDAKAQRTQRREVGAKAQRRKERKEEVSHAALARSLEGNARELPEKIFYLISSPD